MGEEEKKARRAPGDERRRARNGIGTVAKALLAPFCVVVLVAALAVGCGGGETPSSAEIVEAFKNEGLTVVDPRLVKDDDLGMAPQTFKEGTHFVASKSEDLGAKVFTYESEEDRQKMQDFYEGFSGMFSSHVYAKDLTLLQINGQLPKADADRYGEILEGM